MTTKLERLLEKEAQIKAQIQQAKAAERTLEKKRDTRRKILVGAAVMARVESGRWPKEDLLEMMDSFLSRPNERELFDLDSETAASAKQKAESSKAPKDKASKAAGPKSRRQHAGKKLVGKTRKPLPESSIDVDNEFNL